MENSKTTDVTITIIDGRRWVRTLVSWVVLVFGPILLGIVASSSAMQWAGFFMGSIALIGLALNKTKRCSSKEEAKAYIDTLP